MLACAAAVLWCAVQGAWTAAAWRVPANYSGDSFEVLARIQAAAEGGLRPGLHNHIGRLGAPYGAEWSEYPAPDDVLMVGLGWVARLVGLGVASNLALLLATVSSALSFYLCARHLRCRPGWAAACGLLFAFSYFNLSRGLPHLSFTFSYTVPPALLSCWLVAGSGRLRRGREALFCLAVALVMGISNPYYLYLYLQLMAWACVAQAIGRRRPANLAIGGGCIALAVAAFFLVNADVWIWAHDGAAPLMSRNYHGTELYALKPIELFLPPPLHRAAWLGDLGRRYVRWSPWRGEPFSPYLGIVGAIGLLGLLGSFVLRLLGRRKIGASGAALQAVWILIFSAIGGINSILAFFVGLQIFRATNRFSIFLLALALFFVALRGSRFSRRHPAWGWALAMLAVAAGLLDQVPRPRPEARATAAADYASDEALAAALRRRLPADAMIFQMPWVAFPEAGPRYRLSDYELFRPYLHTRTFRFTYGYLRGRARGQWYRDYSNLPAGRLVEKLESSGFAAIYVNRRGYADRGEALLAALTAAGRSERVAGLRGDQVVVFLHPKSRTTAPLASTPTFGDGWNPARPGGAPGSARWAHGPAVLCYFNPLGHAVKATLSLAARGAGSGPRHLSIRLDGKCLSNEIVSTDVHAIPPLEVTLQPGDNCFNLTTDADPIRAEEEPHRLRTFAVQQLALRVDPSS